MKRSAVRVGLIGTGDWSRRCYLPAFSSLAGAELAALSGRNRPRLDKLADAFDIQDRFTDYRQLIGSEGVDAVVIVAPNERHHPMTMAALEAGKHVLCEKPLALNARQGGEMVSRAEAAGVVNMIGFTLRFFDAFNRAQSLVSEGYAGTPLHLQSAFLHSYVTAETPLSWYQVREQAGAGALGDIGPHVIDQLHLAIGKIERVSGDLGVRFPRVPAPEGSGSAEVSNDDYCSFAAEFGHGLRASVLVSRIAADLDMWCELHGTEGALRWGYRSDGSNRVAEVLGMRRGSGRFERLLSEGPFMPDEPPAAYKRMAGEFVAAILEERPARPSFKDGQAVQQVIDSVLRSAASGGRWTGTAEG